MPLYEYQCEACGHRFEVIQKYSDRPAEVCTVCGKGPVVRQFSSPAIQFKGSGWYITDYARKGQSDKTSTDAKGDGAKSDSTKAEGKTDSAAKTETTTKTETSTTKTDKTSTE